MIIWLSSYPRSGNTFLRTLIKNCYGKNTYSIYNDPDIGNDQGLMDVTGHQILTHQIGAPNFDLTQYRKNEDLLFLKTHEISRDLVKPEDKVIYILRDGRQATLSFHKYLKDFSNQEISPIEISMGFDFPGGSWNDHVANWQPKDSKDTLLIRFENLISDPKETVDQISNFIDLEVTEYSIPEFEDLQKINSRFFRQGKSNSFKKELSEEEQAVFLFKSYPEMVDYGYTDAQPQYIKGLPKEAVVNVSNGLNKGLSYLKKKMTAMRADLGSQLQKKDFQINSLNKEVEKQQFQISSLENTRTAYLKIVSKYEAKLEENNSYRKESYVLKEQLQLVKEQLSNLKNQREVIIHQLQEEAKAHRTLAITIHALKNNLKRKIFGRRFISCISLPLIPKQIDYQKFFQKKESYPQQAAIISKNSALPRDVCTPIANRINRYPDKTGDRTAEGGLRLTGIPKSSSPSKPLISVVTTVYNSIEFIEQAMQSVFNQTYDNIEYIVIDALSNDGTLDIIKSFANKLDYYISEPDSGIYSGINKGISLSRGEYVLILNSDDYFTPNAIELMVNAALESGSQVVAANANFIDPKGKHLRTYTSYWDERIFIRCTLMHEAMLVKNDLYNIFGFYNENCKVISDWLWMIKIYGVVDVCLLNEVVLMFRTGGASSTQIKIIDEERLALLRNVVGDVTKEDCNAMRYPHHLSPDEINFFSGKYKHLPKLSKALKLFLAD